MKKTLSLLLAAAMLLAIAPMTVSAYEDSAIPEMEASLKKSDNLAYGKTVIHPENALDQGAGSSWTPANLTDGTMNYDSTTHETTGYHSQHNAFGGNADKNHEEWVGIDFGTATEFDTLVLYPNRPQDGDFSGTDGKCPSFPNAFRVEVSNDGESWAAQTITVNGNDAGAAKTICNFDPPTPDPVTVQFPAVKARYVRFVGVSLNFLAEGFYLKLTEIAVYNKGFKPGEYTYYENVVSGKPVTVPVGAAHEDDVSNWHLTNINNGDRYDMVTSGANNDYGQFAGFHTKAPDKPTAVTLDFELGEGTTLNQVVIYPSSEKFSGTAHTGSANAFYFPANFTLEVSNDGKTWTTVKTVTDYSVTSYAPQIFDLGKVYTAKYLRFAMTDLPDYVKLSELEAYDTTKPLTANQKDEKPADPVVKENYNFAPDATVFFSGVINSGNWNQANLNNGTVENDGGFTSSAGETDTALYVGLDLGAVTRVNTVVLYSAQSDAEADIEWSGIPKSFKIQVSNDQFNWKTVKEVNNTSVPKKLTACTYTFEATDAQYIRILASENYPKGSDGNKCYIQLAEMQVSYITSGGQTPVPTPPTGDATLVWASVAVLALICGAAAVSKKRRCL